ncbi:hypothetical protein RHECIAT_CH0002647 [Rhizobium etli CIAT 652]|uniref:Uncharacterized protein n=1 Tax=Rhizobium etli (strain CIAT 652) TaxID=491916 RepID=B3PRN9_RHIE6|nr:hypothetical protein RHECIAT_CH0002647 [Rhizobium etli CIAT 652]
MNRIYIYRIRLNRNSVDGVSNTGRPSLHRRERRPVPSAPGLSEFLRRIGLTEHPVAGCLDPAQGIGSLCEQIGADLARHRGLRRDPDEGFRSDIDRGQELSRLDPQDTVAQIEAAKPFDHTR